MVTCCTPVGVSFALHGYDEQSEFTFSSCNFVFESRGSGGVRHL